MTHSLTSSRRRAMLSRLRAWAFYVYYGALPTRAGKNRGLAYCLLRKRQS